MDPQLATFLPGVLADGLIYGHVGPVIAAMGPGATRELAARISHSPNPTDRGAVKKTPAQAPNRSMRLVDNEGAIPDRQMGEKDAQAGGKLRIWP